MSLLLSAYPSIRLSAQCPDGSPPPCRPQPARVAPPPNSVAVLYFDNLSPDTGDAYLADGLTEAIIVRLGRVERLVVKSPTAVRRLRGRSGDTDPATLGRALGVTHLVQGSVRRRAGRLLMTVTLTRAATGVQVWGERYDRLEGDLLSLEEEIGRHVATAVSGRLLPAESQGLAARPTRSAAAYDHYLRGDFLLAQRTAHSATRAVAEYEAAVRLDSAFAQAWARIAYAAALFLDWNWVWPAVPRDEVLARGLAAEAQARALDPASADAWMARGYLLAGKDPGGEATNAALERAVALDPHNVEASHQYGLLLLDLGRDSAARVALERTVAIEPTRAIGLAALAWLEFVARREAEALRWADSALSADPAFAHGYEHRAQIRAYLGRYAEARADAEQAVRLGKRPASLAMLAIVEALAGDTRAAQQHVGDIDPVRGVDQHLWTIAALVVIGQRARALDALERLPWRPRQFPAALRAREFDPVRSDPRFQRLVEESRPPGAPR